MNDEQKVAIYSKVPSRHTPGETGMVRKAHSRFRVLTALSTEIRAHGL
jgi:hypothetical protein